MEVITYFERHSSSSRTGWLRDFPQFQGQISDFFCYAWIFSPNSGLLTLAANQCCSQSMLQPINAAANIAEFILICHYLPVYHHQSHILPLASNTHTSIPLYCSSEHQWGSSDMTQWGTPFSASFSSLSLLKGKAIYFYCQLTSTYFYSSFRFFNNFKSLCVWFIFHITCCFISIA